VQKVEEVQDMHLLPQFIVRAMQTPDLHEEHVDKGQAPQVFPVNK
jgi:hypothetical protein